MGEYCPWYRLPCLIGQDSVKSSALRGANAIVEQALAAFMAPSQTCQLNRSNPLIWPYTFDIKHTGQFRLKSRASLAGAEEMKGQASSDNLLGIEVRVYQPDENPPITIHYGFHRNVEKYSQKWT